jgi:hypothetical protein
VLPRPDTGKSAQKTAEPVVQETSDKKPKQDENVMQETQKPPPRRESETRDIGQL